MSWDGEQKFSLSAGSEQAASLTIMAEAFWGRPGAASESGNDGHIFCGHYRTIDEGILTEILGDRPLPHGALEHRVILSPSGPRNMLEALRNSVLGQPAKYAAGIAFPYRYSYENAYEPLSFVFLREEAPRCVDRPWRLVTAVPLVPVWEGILDDRVKKERLSNAYPCLNRIGDIGEAYWPQAPIVEPDTIMGVWDGCEIALRRSYPSMLTAFLYFAGEQLGLKIQSDPEVEGWIDQKFREDWEKEFPVEQCFAVAPGRVKFWSDAFGIRNLKLRV